MSTPEEDIWPMGAAPIKTEGLTPRQSKDAVALQRAEIELVELRERLLKLTAFMASEQFYGLHDQVRRLWVAQQVHMNGYLLALGERTYIMKQQQLIGG